MYIIYYILYIAYYILNHIMYDIIILDVPVSFEGSL